MSDFNRRQIADLMQDRSAPRRLRVFDRASNRQVYSALFGCVADALDAFAAGWGGNGYYCHVLLSALRGEAKE